MAARNLYAQSPPKGSDPHLLNCWHAQFTDKVRTTISAGAGAVKQGVKKGTAAVRHGADAVKKVFGGKEDFKHLDFLETCKAADKQLRKLDIKYTRLIVYELDETRKQFKEKQILISVFGRQNTGKSTLLNSVLKARLLPMKELAETGAKVFIQHNGDTAHLIQSTDAATVEQSAKCPILYLEYKFEQPVEEVKEVEHIYKKLQSLNANAHESDKAVVPKCTLKTCVPFLADVPPEWDVRLVDTPGFGEFDSCVEALAKEALKSSSVCVYITAYNDLRAQANGDYLRFILQHDQGVFEGNRLIIVITKFDQQSGSAELSDTNEEITEKDAKEKTCQFVREICPSAKISHDDVLPVSGRWAYHARMLANSHKCEPTHDRCQSNVRKCLRDVPNRMCGQGEDPYASLEDSKLSAELEKASGINVLEARIETMTKSCFQIWVSKMTGDYDRYLTQAVEKMKNASNELADEMELDKKHQQSKQDCFEAITALRRELEASMKHENSRVYMEISAKYPEDIEKSQPQQMGKDVIRELMLEFQSQCLEKVRDRKLDFGPRQLTEDLIEFLKNAEKELDKTFNSSCAFTEIYQVLIRHSGDMRATVEQMRGKARELCGSPLMQCIEETAEESEGGVQEDIAAEESEGGVQEDIAAEESEGGVQEDIAAEESEGGVQEDIAAEESEGGVQEDIAAEQSEGEVQEDIPPETPTLAELKNNSEIPALELAAPETNEGGVQEDMELEAPNLGDNGLAAEGGMQGSIKLVAPNLGHIKDEVEIPSVSLSFWDKFADHWREVGDLFSNCFETKKSQAEKDDCQESSHLLSTSAAKPSEPSTYRRWDPQLKGHIATLQQCLEEECDAYFVKIQKDAIKYFHGQYCQETRAQLQSFDQKFKKKIDEQLKMLKNNIDVKCKEKHALDDMGTHLSALKAHLHDAAGKYLKKWQVA